MFLVLDVHLENQRNKLPLALYYECFGLIRKTGLKWFQLLGKRLTQFAVWFVPFPVLYRDSEILR